MCPFKRHHKGKGAGHVQTEAEIQAVWWGGMLRKARKDFPLDPLGESVPTYLSFGLKPSES